MLHSEPGLEPLGEAKTGVEAIAQFRALHPDVTLMDLRMPELSGVEAITAILKDCPDARIIILTTYDGDEDIYRGLQTGTVKFHITNILQKLGVSDRTSAVVTAFQRGIANL